MESVYWIARRYDIPFLMIVLNNGGWNAPKVSALLVHKDGLSSKSNRRGESIKILLLFTTGSLIRDRSQHLLRSFARLPRNRDRRRKSLGSDDHDAR